MARNTEKVFSENGVKIMATYDGVWLYGVENGPAAAAEVAKKMNEALKAARRQYSEDPKALQRAEHKIAERGGKELDRKSNKSDWLRFGRDGLINIVFGSSAQINNTTAHASDTAISYKPPECCPDKVANPLASNSLAKKKKEEQGQWRNSSLYYQ